MWGATQSTPAPFNFGLIMIVAYSDSVIRAQFDAHVELRHPFIAEYRYFAARYKSEIPNLQNRRNPHSEIFRAAGSKSQLEFYVPIEGPIASGLR